MILPDSWAALNWIGPVFIMLMIAVLAIVWCYRAAKSVSPGLRLLLAGIKLSALVLLAICLLEPMHRYTRPEPGANLFIVLADDSRSLQIKDRGQTRTRETNLKNALTDDGAWLERIEQDFDLRKYQFDSQLRPVTDFAAYSASRHGTSVLNSLKLIAGRFANRPSAGIMLMTDGNATDYSPDALDELLAHWNPKVPVFPVVIGDKSPARDIAVSRVTSSQTNFETAPVTITAEILVRGYGGQRIVVQLLDEEDREVERKEVDRVEDDKLFAVRFKTRPERRGVNVYHVKAFASGEEERVDTAAESPESTLVNNRRTVIVDRGRGPFRVLYVTGRPNWELKFLRRAAADDDEIELVALVRIAKREPKFSFRGRTGQQTNPLFRGFGDQQDETAEQHDEPVFLRLGTRDKDELRDGFPQDADTLFQYDAIVLDDLEAGFFTQDQKSLLQQFVSLRGGGLMMLGGQESFGAGSYDHTAIGEMLPVYVSTNAQPSGEGRYRLNLTREGWLQPWVRVKPTEEQEQKRLDTMPEFKTMNLLPSIKPGATVLATVDADRQPYSQVESGDFSGARPQKYPALVVQTFGKGRTAAMLIGDLWRWQLRSESKNDDLLQAWRQSMRWLVADVPRRVEVTSDNTSGINRAAQIEVKVYDEAFRPLDDADVSIAVTTPGGESFQLAGEPVDSKSGVYAASFVSRQAGAYRADVNVTAADGAEIEQRQSGWVSEPENEEFQRLQPNRKLLSELAERTGGELVELSDLDGFVGRLNRRQVPISQTHSDPWWHRWAFFVVAIGLLVTEWGIRRWKGLP